MPSCPANSARTDASRVSSPAAAWRKNGFTKVRCTRAVASSSVSRLHLGAPATGQQAGVGDRAAVAELLRHPLTRRRPATVVKAAQHRLNELQPVIAVLAELQPQLVLGVR